MRPPDTRALILALALLSAVWADDLISIPDQRRVSATLDLADLLIERRELLRAEALLRAVAEMPADDDCYVPTSDPHRFVGARHFARQSLRRLRARPRVALESELKKAAADLFARPDRARLTKLIRAHPETETAGRLRILLGDVMFEQGEILGARRLWSWQADRPGGMDARDLERLRQRLDAMERLEILDSADGAGATGDHETRLVCDGRLAFSLSASGLFAMDLRNKLRIWSDPGLVDDGETVLAAGFGRVVLVQPERLLVLDAVDGSRIGEVALDPRALAIQEGSVPAGVFLSSDGAALVFFLSRGSPCELCSVVIPSDGKLRRSTYLADCDATCLPIRLRACLGPDGGSVVYVGMRGAILALQGQTGEPIWARTSGTLQSPACKGIAVGRSLVYVRLEQGRVDGLDLESGETRCALRSDLGTPMVDGRNGLLVVDRFSLVEVDGRTLQRKRQLEFSSAGISPRDPSCVIALGRALLVPEAASVTRLDLETGRSRRARLRPGLAERPYGLVSCGGEIFAVHGSRFQWLEGLR